MALTYTAIADTDIDADSPITASLMTLLRDNPLAVFANDAGPDIIGLDPITSMSLSSDATADFDSLGGTYPYYYFLLANVVLSVDSSILYGRMKVSGTVQSGASDYAYMQNASSFDGSAVATAGSGTDGDNTTSAIQLGPIAGVAGADKIGSGAGEGISGELKLVGVDSTTIKKKMFGLLTFDNGTDELVTTVVGGAYNVHSSAVDGFQLYPDSGVFESGDIYMYGGRT